MSKEKIIKWLEKVLEWLIRQKQIRKDEMARRENEK